MTASRHTRREMTPPGLSTSRSESGTLQAVSPGRSRHGVRDAPGMMSPMSVVKINAIAVPPGAGPELEARFAARARSVEQMPGFEDFQLLRPVEGEERYFVYTRWDSEESFQAWVNSAAFTHAHAKPESADGKPVSSGAHLLAFEVVQHVVKA